MNEEQSRHLENLKHSSQDLGYDWIDYWQNYSSIDTWQFWANIAFLVVPLVMLFFKLDRKRAFHIGFFGYSCHVISTYIDGYSSRFANWKYPYKIIPLLPFISLVFSWRYIIKMDYQHLS